MKYPTAQLTTEQDLPYYNSLNNVLYINTVKYNRLIEQVDPSLYTKEVNYYMSPISEVQSILLGLYTKGTLDEKEKKDLEKSLKHINLKGILMYGDGNKRHTSYGRFSTLFQGILPKDRELYFRNYQQTFYQWRDTISMVNICPDAKMCWQSMLRKLGAKGVHGLTNNFEPFYVVVWYDLIPKEGIKRVHGL
tara:strand:- start:38031 stop:38606 length:576 start_codon:yes stop_codon:yes gene_type:complete